MDRIHCRVFALVAVVAVVCTAVVAGPTPVGAADPPEHFTGSVDDFYVVPDPLPAGEPGDLIRYQDVSSTPVSTTVRIMYHSVDGAGRDRAVTGTLTYPVGPAPDAGWPVMSIANGTVGMAPACALSRNSDPVYDFGIGGVAVASDYIGEGPVGEIQAYMSRDSEGHSVLDAVRAARNFADAHAGSRFVVLGGSQGGHGALAASELAATWAPELDPAGTVSLAPAAMFDRTYGPLDEIVTRVVTAMGTLGLSTEHPDIDLTDYVSPAGLAAFDVLRTRCMDAVIPAVLGVGDGFFTNDPRTTEPLRSIMRANDVGRVAADSPVLLIQGTEDPLVAPARTDDLFARMCAAGQSTEYLIVDGADHENVTGMALDRIEPWLRDRLDGEPAADDCPDRPPVTTSTSTTTPDTPSTTTAEGTGRPGTTGVGGTSTPDRTEPVAQRTDHAGSETAGAGNGPSGADGELARTGSPLAPLVPLALVAVGVGAVVIAARRRFS